MSIPCSKAAAEDAVVVAGLVAVVGLAAAVGNSMVRMDYKEERRMPYHLRGIYLSLDPLSEFDKLQRSRRKISM